MNKYYVLLKNGFLFDTSSPLDAEQFVADENARSCGVKSLRKLVNGEYETVYEAK